MDRLAEEPKSVALAKLKYELNHGLFALSNINFIYDSFTHKLYVYIFCKGYYKT